MGIVISLRIPINELREEMMMLMITLPKTNIAPKKMVVSNRKVYFQGRTVTFREGVTKRQWF